MFTMEGISASKGISIGKVKKIGKRIQKINKNLVDDIDAEVIRFEKARNLAIKKIEDMIKKIDPLNQDQIEIFETHVSMLKDPDYNGYIINAINTGRKSAEYSVQLAQEEFVSMFSAMDDEYMKERAADVKDISQNILDVLIGNCNDDIDSECIMCAEDLTPSQVLSMNKNKVLGFFLKNGSAASHSSILARTLAIPAVVNVGDELYDKVNDGDEVVLDGMNSKVIVNPDEKTLQKYKDQLCQIMAQEQEYMKLKDLEAKTIDGNLVRVNANIGGVQDIDLVLKNGADGIGLLRSEFIYLSSADYPSEEILFNSYKAVLESMGDKLTIIRTLDIGADKKVDYFNLDEENNPALGLRAIRICLKKKDIFYTQLRALYRASVFGSLAIMIPMIVSVDEVLETKKIIERVKKDLSDEHIEFDDNVQFGIMIETPASVMVSDLLAREVDFFSVGTNDLTQYTMAVDRMNSQIGYLYDSSNLAVLRMIKIAADAIHAQGKWIGICGDSAADLELLPYFLSMGIDELSVSPNLIPKVKNSVRNIDTSKLDGKYVL